MELVNSKDLRIVSRQLGRKIENRFWVVRRCKLGYPVVIKTDPIGPRGPFPTLFWLTCPFLRREIGKLESKGYIKKYQMLLKQNPRLYYDYLKAHRETREMRLSFARELHPDVELSNPLFASLFNGIGGMLNLEGVKCLHLQVANFLGGIENPIGKMVVTSELDVLECDNSFCSVYDLR